MIQPIVSSAAPITLIGGAKPAPGSLTEALNYGEIVVCADGGADTALKHGISPAAVIGDMDSLSNAAQTRFAQVLHPIEEQDSTDFDKALRHVDALVVLGVGFSGARLDHELAVLNVLVRHPHKPCIVMGEEVITLLCPPEITLDLTAGSLVSLFPMAGVGCESVGLQWDTVGLRFAPDTRVGTSNHATGAVTLRPDAPKMLLILPRAALGVALRAVLQGAAKWPAP